MIFRPKAGALSRPAVVVGTPRWSAPSFLMQLVNSVPCDQNVKKARNVMFQKLLFPSRFSFSFSHTSVLQVKRNKTLKFRSYASLCHWGLCAERAFGSCKGRVRKCCSKRVGRFVRGRSFWHSQLARRLWKIFFIYLFIYFCCLAFLSLFGVSGYNLQLCVRGKYFLFSGRWAAYLENCWTTLHFFR